MKIREFYEEVINAEVADELKDFARDQIAKMDVANEKRRNKPSKTAIANEPIVAAISEYLASANGAKSASEVAEAVGISTQKASALLRKLVGDGVATAEEVKLAKKGKCKVYTYVAE